MRSGVRRVIGGGAVAWPVRAAASAAVSTPVKLKGRRCAAAAAPPSGRLLGDPGPAISDDDMARPSDEERRGERDRDTSAGPPFTPTDDERRGGDRQVDGDTGVD